MTKKYILIKEIAFNSKKLSSLFSSDTMLRRLFGAMLLKLVTKKRNALFFLFQC